jgi:hypothetical protein
MLEKELNKIDEEGKTVPTDEVKKPSGIEEPSADQTQEQNV